MKKIGAAISSSLLYLSSAAVVFAAATPTVNPIKLTSPAGSAPVGNVENIPQFIITGLFVIGVIIAIAYLIYGGIRWILSGGDKTAVDAARNHIVAAIIGLAIILAAFFIVNAIFFILTGETFDPGKSICIPTLANPNCSSIAPTPAR